MIGLQISPLTEAAPEVPTMCSNFFNQIIFTFFSTAKREVKAQAVPTVNTLLLPAFIIIF